MDWTEIEVVVKNKFEDNIVGILYLFDIDGINIKDSRDYEEFAKEKPYWVVLDEEDFVDKNSILTAEGIISYLISHRRFPIYHSQIHVLGYGHCGQVIVRDFIALRAYVHVGIRNRQLFEDIEKAGAKPYHLEHMDLSDCDVLINTIPSQVVTSSKLDQAPTSMMILDIASYPYGVDHHYALSKGFNSIILPSIPSKYAYGYAGRMMTDFMKEKMKNV